MLSVELVSRSHRRVAVHKVLVFEPNGDKVTVTWSDQITNVGEPVGAVGGPVLIGPQATLFVRRDDGEAYADGTTVKVFHGFPGSPITRAHQPDGGWLDWVEIGKAPQPNP